MNLSLKGKRAIITAAGGGIGRKTMEAFTEAGAKVYFCDIDEAGVAKANDEVAGGEGVVCDVRDTDALTAFMAAGVAHLGGLDILVNNAGVAGPTAPVEEIALDDWRDCLEINLTSTFLCTQLAVPHLREAGGGSIVNLSSAAGKFGFAMRTPYSAAKWAIVGFTRSIALELGADKIRCNCVQPGPVDGERISRVVQAKADALGISANEMRMQMADITSLKQFVPPEHIAGMILYVCSDIGAM